MKKKFIILDEILSLRHIFFLFLFLFWSFLISSNLDWKTVIYSLNTAKSQFFWMSFIWFIVWKWMKIKCEKWRIYFFMFQLQWIKEKEKKKKKKLSFLSQFCAMLTFVPFEFRTVDDVNTLIKIIWFCCVLTKVLNGKQRLVLFAGLNNGRTFFPF